MGWWTVDPLSGKHYAALRQSLPNAKWNRNTSLFQSRHRLTDAIRLAQYQRMAVLYDQMARCGFGCRNSISAVL